MTIHRATIVATLSLSHLTRRHLFLPLHLHHRRCSTRAPSPRTFLPYSCRWPAPPQPQPPPTGHRCPSPRKPPLPLSPASAALAIALILSSFPATVAARPLRDLPLLPHLLLAPLFLPFLPCCRLLAVTAAATHYRNLLPTIATLAACSPRSLPPTAVFSPTTAALVRLSLPSSFLLCQP
ncbi:hypothetical protein BHE74_00015522 [Ensete ventricosum]|nr:hypothetical protein BHE74_00015522 [Ensete ventricosum]